MCRPVASRASLIAFSFASDAAVGEEEHVDVARRDLGEFRAETGARFRRHERVRVRQHLGLLLDGADDALVAMADVDAHQLAVEVDEPLAFRGPEVDAFGPRHRNRVDLRLRRPLEERVLPAERDDFVAGHLPPFNIASRFALNSLPGFHSGILSASATR